MENEKEKAINDFIGIPEEKNGDLNKKKVIVNEREGLIERLDRVLVTSDGRQLLREQY